MIASAAAVAVMSVRHAAIVASCVVMVVSYDAIDAPCVVIVVCAARNSPVTLMRSSFVVSQRSASDNNDVRISTGRDNTSEK